MRVVRVRSRGVGALVENAEREERDARRVEREIVVALDDAAEAMGGGGGRGEIAGREGESRDGERAPETPERAHVGGDDRGGHDEGRGGSAVETGARGGEREDDVALRKVARRDAADAHAAHAAEGGAVGEVDAVGAKPRDERGDLVRGTLARAGGAEGPERTRAQPVRGAAAVPTAEPRGRRILDHDEDARTTRASRPRHPIGDRDIQDIEGAVKSRERDAPDAATRMSKSPPRRPPVTRRR